MNANPFTQHNQSINFADQGIVDTLSDVYRQDETDFLNGLKEKVGLSEADNQAIENHASELVEILRKERLKDGGLEAFLFQYDLSSEEGIALMCMAEALLRVPDSKTVDKLIKDKLTQGDWESHLGKSHSLFVNAATWALMLTGKVMGEHKSLESRFESKKSLQSGLQKLASKGGEPLVRQAVSHAMKILSKQFVMGRSIKEALKRAKDQERMGYRYSYDMLGEAAFTQDDADTYFEAYQTAIETVAKQNSIDNPIDGPGISIKLSALHPRYEYLKKERVLEQMLPRVMTLVIKAKEANINLTFDSEEAHTSGLLMEVFAKVAAHPDVQGWDGLGIAVQAYQKRALSLIAWLNDLCERHDIKLMVRLVKGAYWDTEIKLAQEQGLSGYPVFTRKAATDVNYLACARALLKVSDRLYPQFATHNAHTVAAVMKMASQEKISAYEFQCLHGMGGPLYDRLVEDKKVPCRIYAPVGTHEHLLAYLVRRLLENGANTSFVNRIVNADLDVKDLVADPVALMESYDNTPHPNIPLPDSIYPDRTNSKGIDINNPIEVSALIQAMNQVKVGDLVAKPCAMGPTDACEAQAISSPFDADNALGKVHLASEAVVSRAIEKAQYAFVHHMPSYKVRAERLVKLADHLEANMAKFMAILMLEAGKTVDDALAEVREAVDFCRYYSAQTLSQFKPKTLKGPTGEFNELSLWGKGVMACISPWNFPMAIFLGQVSAAFAAGNAVIAKPASQTPLIAQAVIEAIHEAGIEHDLIQLLPGRGSLVGNHLVEDTRIKGLLFTGSTQTAQGIHIKLANRQGEIIPFIAETGGQNAMIVDSTALTEQVITDVITSSFKSAGQRCSSLRVLYVQEDVFDRVTTMLKGAVAELKVGNPVDLATDVGPVIDKHAQKELCEHIQWLKEHATLLCQAELDETTASGTFVAPCAYEIKSISELSQENFGPVLHVIRFKASELDQVIEDINNTQYGLTLGIHSRIDETVAHIVERAHVGNIYVNRNMIGAVVGVQPFGGEGLSGTGPKAGGPHYLTRLATERVISINTTAAGGNASLMALGEA